VAIQSIDCGCPAKRILAAPVRESAVGMEKNASETQLRGNPIRGQALFRGNGNCTSCHRVGETGSALGPNLTAAGTHLTVVEIDRNRYCSAEA
jgi:cytochrome c2